MNNGTRSAADTAALITYNCNGYDVKGTVVIGRLLYFDGCYTTMDIERVMSDAVKIGAKIRDAS